MTLVSSGVLNLKGSGSVPSTSIVYEITGTIVTPYYLMADAHYDSSPTIGTASDTRISDFYGFRYFNVPGTVNLANTYWYFGTGQAQQYFSNVGEPADDYEYQYSINGGAFSGSIFIAASPVIRTPTCGKFNTIAFRVRARNAAGFGGWSFNSCTVVTQCQNDDLCTNP